MPGLDFKLVRLANNIWDIGVDLDGDFLTEDAFDTSIIVSLQTDARADASEVFEPERRRGWPGSPVASCAPTTRRRPPAQAVGYG